MARVTIPTKQELFEMFMDFESRWLHEDKFHKGSAGWADARELRLNAQRYRKAERIKKRILDSAES